MKIKLPFVEFDVDSTAACASAGCISVAFLVPFVAVSYGFTPFSKGFASAESVSTEFTAAAASRRELKQGLSDLHDMLVKVSNAGLAATKESQLISMHQRECEARLDRQTARGADRREALEELVRDRAEAVERLLKEYRDLAKADYPLRPCP